MSYILVIPIIFPLWLMLPDVRRPVCLLFIWRCYHLPNLSCIHHCSLCLNFVHLLDRKPNLEKNYIYSSIFFHNFPLSESSFTCTGLWASGLAKTVISKFKALWVICYETFSLTVEMSGWLSMLYICISFAYFWELLHLYIINARQN